MKAVNTVKYQGMSTGMSDHLQKGVNSIIDKQVFKSIL